jgi:hypothetical protein
MMGHMMMQQQMLHAQIQMMMQAQMQRATMYRAPMMGPYAQPFYYGGQWYIPRTAGLGGSPSGRWARRWWRGGGGGGGDSNGDGSSGDGGSGSGGGGGD